MDQKVLENTKQKNKALQSLRVYVTADMSQIDEAISKIKELKELLGSLEVELTINAK